MNDIWFYLRNPRCKIHDTCLVTSEVILFSDQIVLIASVSVAAVLILTTIYLGFYLKRLVISVFQLLWFIYTYYINDVDEDYEHRSVFISNWFRVLCMKWKILHYNDVIMSAMASQITSLTIVYSTVYSGADQWKHQSSASLAFVRGIHRVNSPHKDQ